jgi:hypothetical protein
LQNHLKIHDVTLEDIVHQNQRRITTSSVV